ncbi:MAG: phosphate ABC transporter ATP-binding protein [Ardenticatenaceae bacterium]
MERKADYCYELIEVCKRYGRREVLRIDHLTIREGKTLALLGPSGAGKSTLLRLLNFLEVPNSGQLCYAGQVIESQPPLSVRRTVTTVFQKPLLLNNSVWNNVAYGLWLRGRREPKRVEAVLERVGMGHLAKANATTLSGGEAQRVALARALVIDPKVLLLDEPTANLDPANVALIEKIIQELQGGPATLVIVTHNLFQARRLADDAALLINGQLVEFGPTEPLFEQPRDPRTAAFMAGTMIW